LSSVIANLIHFGLATVVFLVYMTANAVWWGSVNGRWDWPIPATVFLAPIPMAGLALLVTGVALFISVWTLYFEDMRYIADSGLKILNWLVPVIWFPDMLRHISRFNGEVAYRICMLNPLACFITVFRRLCLIPTTLQSGDPAVP